MNEIKSTIEYLKTLKLVYQDKGLASAVKHEIGSTMLSFTALEAYMTAYAFHFSKWLGRSKTPKTLKEDRSELEGMLLGAILNPDLTA